MEAGSSPPGQRASQKHKILVINPNSNVEMTDGMQRLIEGQYKDLKVCCALSLVQVNGVADGLPATSAALATTIHIRTYESMHILP
jgi:Asp/Glu/hydantoin racemase